MRHLPIPERARRTANIDDRWWLRQREGCVKVLLPFKASHHGPAHRASAWAWPGAYETYTGFRGDAQAQIDSPAVTLNGHVLWQPCVVLDLHDALTADYLMVSRGETIRPFFEPFEIVRGADEVGRAQLAAIRSARRLAAEAG